MCVAPFMNTHILIIPLPVPSLIPRPHPLTRRNGLVNQVEFLGLAHAFATMQPSNDQNILRPAHSKKVRMLEWRLTNFTVVRKVLRNNYQSHNLIGHYSFWVISPRNSTLFTRPFLTERCAQAGHETRTGPRSQA